MTASTIKNVVAAAIFIAFAIFTATVVPSLEIAVVCSVLLLTVYLFAFEIVSVDVAAVSVMVLLGLISAFSLQLGLAQPLVPSTYLFSGFSSNAVMSIVAVMIIGAGLDKTGLMGKVAAAILKFAGRTEGRVIPAISGSVGFISSFMQNVGAAALFLPVVSRISARTGLQMSRLLMPMGFCAILGGTITMVGSSPLILLNDLILTSNKALPASQQMETWSLFSVTPIGIALLLTGIVYFVFAGRYVLPARGGKEVASATNTMTYFQDLYGLDYGLFEVVVPADSPLVGGKLDDIEHVARVRVIAAMAGTEDVRIGPGGLDRDTGIVAGTVFGILAAPENLRLLVEKFGLTLRADLITFAEALTATKAGIAEIVIPPGSSLIDKSARDVWMRKTYGIAMLALHRQGKTMREGEGIRDLPLQAGDTLIVHTTWAALAQLESNRDFVIVTTEYPHEELRPHKVRWALTAFGTALFMILFTDVMLSTALFAGAIGMILTGVLRMEEAYRAVSWKSVFLLASLIPLGFAVETSGTAAWIAQQTLPCSAACQLGCFN
jgi:di/tricarboxylate transporter